MALATMDNAMSYCVSDELCEICHRPYRSDHNDSIPIPMAGVWGGAFLFYSNV